MFSEIAVAMAMRAIQSASLPPPATAMVQTFEDPAPYVAEDDPEFDCRWNGNHVCGIGADPVFPHLPTVYGVPVDSLAQAHRLSIIIGSALGVGSDSYVIVTDPAELNRLIDAGAAARAAADY